ncbi:MAG: hypothetical protein WAT42_06800, partial [Candidatus Nanopelagicales bacterium]
IAQQEAASLIEDAELRARAIVEDAAQEAEALAAQAREQTSAERLQTDEFVDGKLADLEESLATSLSAVRRGRDRVHARRAAFDPVDLRSSNEDPAMIFDQVFE